MAMLLAALGAAGQAQAGPMVTLTGDTTFAPYSGPNMVAFAPLYVGISGVGTLTAADGGQVTISPGYTVILADSASAQGTINIGAAPGAAPVGAGFLATSLLQFGAGTGTLNFNTNSFHDFGAALVSRDAGTHQLNHYAGSTRLVGDSSGFVGKTTVTGGSLQILNILGTTEGRIDAGQAPGATARVSVFSPGSTWALTDNLFVGGAGLGELSISSTGTVSNQFATVAAQQNGAAKVTVSDVGSLWSNRATLLVGTEGGMGSVSILAGGYVTSVDGVVGREEDGSGVFLVSGRGSAWTNSGELRVGDVYGRGILSIEAGGFVSNKDSYVGSVNGNGSVVVRGAGSIWDNSGAMILGFGTGLGAGTLTIAQGGAVNVGANGGGTVSLAQDRFFIFPTTGTINIGAAAGQPAVGAGTLNASAIQFGAGIATVNLNHTEPAYTFSTRLLSTGAGTHSLNQIAGTTLLTGANSSFRGRTTVSGGKLVVLGQLGGSAAVTGGVLQYGDGATGAANTLSGNLNVSGAGSTLAVHRGATLAVTGDVEMADGTVLDLMAGTGSPLLQANKVTLGDGVVFRLSGIADKSGLNTVLIEAPTGGIDGDFGAVSVGGFTGEVDYLTVNTRKSADNKQYLATYDLSWTANNNLAHGTFTLADASNRFTLGVPLSDQAANAAAGWDGKSLTKAGAGTLVLQGANTYSGGTAIVGGTLQVDRDANLGAAAGGLRFGDGTLATTASFDTARAVTLAQSGRFDVAADTTLGLTGAVSGAGALVKSGAGTMVLSGNNSHGGGTTIASGTLQIDRDANLGATAGGLAFGDGTLAATATFDTARTVALAQSGRFDVTTGATLGLTGAVSGAGALAKSGGGTLVLSGNNSYGGGTTIAAGTLQVASDANLGAASGGVAFSGGTLAASASFDTARAMTLTQAGRFEVAGGATLGLVGAVSGNADLIKTGAGTLRLDNAGNAYGNTQIQEGALIGNAGSIRGNVDNNGTLVFDQGANATFGGAISGGGALVKNGAGTLGLTGDSSGFTGSTTVLGGRLALNGKLGGALTIGQGGVLGGRGTIGSGAGSVVTVAAGGTLAPGNSIGTLTVDGNLVIENGARYAVETNPQGADADLIHVTGNATINGGSVAHIGIGGGYGLRSVYTILAADGTLSGRFDTVTSDYAFLTPKLGHDYGAGRVSLELTRNGTAMASAANTRNQHAAAGAIDSIGMAAGNGLYDAIATLPDDKGLLRSSFDQLSGEIHASAKTVLLEDSRYVRDAANERLRSAAGAVGASAAPVLASAGGGARLAPATAMGPASWIQGLGSWRQTDGDGNAAQVKSSTGGFLLGVDAPVSDAWRLGLMAGYTRTDFDVRDRASSGDSDNYHLGAYGGGQWGALGLRGGLAYSWHDISTRRSVSMPGYSDRLKANYDGRTVQAFADLSYRIDTSVAAFEPFANLAYVNLKTDGYNESGGAAALRASSQTTETTYTTLGSRVMSGFELGGAQATARGSLGWRYAFGDLKPTATQAFSAGDAFTVAGVPIAKNSAVLEAGLDVQVSRKVSFDLSYQGQLASGAQDHGVRAGVSVRF